MIHQTVFQRIETKVSGNSQCQNNFRRSHKSKSIRITVGTFGKITVKGSHYRVFTGRIVRMAFPLSDTGTTGISHNRSSHLFEHIHHAVTLGRSTNLFGSRIHNQRCRHSQILFIHLPGNRNGTADILIRRVGTRSYQPHFHLPGITVCYHFLCKL